MLLALSLATTATAALPDPSSAQSVGWITLTLAALFAAGNQGMGFLEKFRAARKPDPADVSLDRVKALEERMQKVELKMENHMGQISAKFDAISTTLTNLQSDWNYAVGRIDGRHETQG